MDRDEENHRKFPLHHGYDLVLHYAPPLAHPPFPHRPRHAGATDVHLERSLRGCQIADGGSCSSASICTSKGTQERPQGTSSNTGSGGEVGEISTLPLSVSSCSRLHTGKSVQIRGL